MPVDFEEIVESGDLSALEACIQQGVDPIEMSSALMWAIGYNSLEVVDRLLREESLIVPRDAFFFAVALNNATIIERLLEDERIDVNFENEHRQSPLHLLFIYAPKELFLKFFNNARVDPNKRNSDEKTVLHLAAKENELFLDILKRPDVDINLPDFIRRIALDDAICHEQPSNALALLNDSRIHVESVRRIGEWTFTRALEMGQVEVVQRLVEIKPAWDLRFGTSAIELALKNRFKKAIRNENIDLLSQLFAAEVDYARLNNPSNTPIEVAVQLKKLGCLDFLLQQEKLVIPKCILINAVSTRDPEIVARLLQDSRVDINYHNVGNNSALTIAINHNWIGIARILINDHRIEVNNPARPSLHQAAKNSIGRDMLDELMLSGKIDINFRNYVGHTALFVAISHQREQAALELLQVPGIDVNLERDIKESAINLAIQMEFLDLAQALLVAEADVCFEDKHGKTALDYANEKGFKELAMEIERIQCTGIGLK